MARSVSGALNSFDWVKHEEGRRRHAAGCEPQTNVCEEGFEATSESESEQRTKRVSPQLHTRCLVLLSWECRTSDFSTRSPASSGCTRLQLEHWVRAIKVRECCRRGFWWLRLQIRHQDTADAFPTVCCFRTTQLWAEPSVSKQSVQWMDYPHRQQGEHSRKLHSFVIFIIKSAAPR